MTTLAEALNLVTALLQNWPLCRAVQMLDTYQFSESQFALKVRAELNEGSVLQIRWYSDVQHIDYAYQLFKADHPVLRWDHKEHFTALSTQPHHFHSHTGQVIDSPLTGDPQHDLPLVLDAVSAFLSE